MIKEENQCKRKILSRNYVASKLTLTGIPAETGKVTCLIKRISMINNNGKNLAVVSKKFNIWF